MRKPLLAALALGSLLAGCALLSPPPDSSRSSSLQSAASAQIPSAAAMPAPPPPAEGELPLLILLDLGGDAISPAERNALSQRLWYDLLRTGHFAMVPRDVVPLLLMDRGISLRAPRRDPLPLTVIGRQLQTQYLVTGTVGVVGDTTMLDCSLLDVTEDEVVGIGSVTARGDVDDLLPRIRGLVADLTRELGPRPIQRVAARGSDRTGQAPPPRPPDIRALRHQEIPPTQEAESQSVVTFQETAEVSEEGATVAEEVTVTEAVVEPAPQAVEPVTPVEEPSEEPSGLPDADSSEQVAETSGSGLPRLSEPSADAQIASARQALRESIMTAVNPYGTLVTDPAEASAFVAEAESFAADSPMRARMLERALELNPQDPPTLLQASQAHFMQQDYERARDEALAAISLEPDNSNAHTILGAAYHHMGEHALAVAAQMRALELHGTNHFAQYNLALSLESLDPPQAAEAFERYVQTAQGIDGQRVFVERAQQRIEAIRQTTAP